MGSPINPTYTQNHFLFYESNGTTQVGTEDLETILDVDTIYYCVTSCFDTTANKINDVTIRWQYNLASGGWLDVSTTTPLQFANGSLTDGDTAQTSKTSETGTFQGSRVYETINDAAIVWSTPGDETDNYGEAWLGLTIDSAQVSDAQELLLRCILGDGTVFTGTYTNADIEVNEVAGAVIETITAGTWAVLTEQALLVNEQELLSAETMQVLAGQTFVTNAKVTETITAAIWALLVEQLLSVNEQELLGIETWQGLTGQALTLPASSTTFQAQISITTRDGQETNDATWQESGQDSDGNYVGFFAGQEDMGMSWDNVTVPQGATIISAIIEVFMTYKEGTGDVPTRMQGFDVDDVAVFSSTDRPSQKPQTTALVDRTLLHSEFVDNTWLPLDDCKDIIQEIIDRSGWASGQALGVVLKDNGAVTGNDFQFQDYGRNTAQAAKITIEYTEAAGVTETITAATWNVLVEQLLLVNEQELISAETWQVLTGQPFVTLGAEVITLVASTWQVFSGRSLNAADQEVLVSATWQVLIEQAMQLNVTEHISAGTFAQLVGQIVNALGDEVLIITPATFAQLVGQLLFATVDVTEIVSSGTWAAFTGQPITFAAASTEIIGAGTFAQLLGKSLTITSADVPVLVENLWRTTEETIRVKKSYEITDIDRDYP